MDKVNSLFKSRRFWMAVAGVVAVVGKDALGVELSEDQLMSVASIIAVWIFGDTLRETK